jgi:TRAP-type C4-dicarboxylate transport system substrate-binding protein
MKNTSLKNILGLAGAIVLVLVLLFSILLTSCSKATPTNITQTTAPVTTAVKPIKLVFSTINAKDSWLGQNLYGAYASEIEKRTGGRVIVEMHWNGELVSLPDAYDAIKKGSVDMAEFFPTMLAGRTPMEDVVSFTPADSYNFRPGQTFLELQRAFPQMLQPYNDVKLLWSTPCVSDGVGTTKKPITDIASSKGLKISPVGQWSAANMESLGWVPVSVPPQDSTSSLEKGVVDGTGMGMYLLWDFGWGKIVKYISTPIHINEMLMSCAMNLDTFNKLPSDIQKIITDYTSEFLTITDKALIKNDIESKDRANKEFGTTFVELTSEEQSKMVGLLAPVKAKYIESLKQAGLPSQEFVGKYEELCHKYSDSQYAPD